MRWRALAEIGVTVDEIVVNRVTPSGTALPRLRSRGAPTKPRDRRASGGIARRRRCRLICRGAARSRAGLAALRRIGAALRRALTGPRRPEQAARSGSRPVERSRDIGAAGCAARRISRGTRLSSVGGKGGVGKTTAAAASLFALARDDAASRVLLLSTDPAHSLGDVLAADGRTMPRAIDGAPAESARARAGRAGGPGGQARRARSGAAGHLADAARQRRMPQPVRPRHWPSSWILRRPGSTSCSACCRWWRLAQTYDAVVVDTAPTGHALRLLEMPDARARVGSGAAARAAEVSQIWFGPGRWPESSSSCRGRFGTLQELLRDRAATRFIVVTRAAELPRLETARLMARLRRLRVPTPAVIVNAADAGAGAVSAVPRDSRGRAPRAGAARPPVPRAYRLRYHPDAARRAAAARRGRARPLGADLDVMKPTGTYVYCLVAAARRPQLTRSAGLPGRAGPAASSRAVPAAAVSRSGWSCADAPLDRYGEAAINAGCRISTGCRARRWRTKRWWSRSSARRRCCR